MLVNDKSNILQRSLHGLDLVQDASVPRAVRSRAPTLPNSPQSELITRSSRKVRNTEDECAVVHAQGHDVEEEKEWGHRLGNEWQWKYLQGGVCVIKGLRTGWSRASAMAADAASSAVEMLEHGEDALNPQLHAVRKGAGAAAQGAHTKKVWRSKAAAGVLDEDDCVWVEREPMPWIKSAAVDETEWRSWFDATGILKDPDTLRSRIYYGGLAASVRREGWKWLLGCYPAKSTKKDRATLLLAKKQEYLAYKQQWQSITPEQEARFSKVCFTPFLPAVPNQTNAASETLP